MLTRLIDSYENAPVKPFKGNKYAAVSSGGTERYNL
jgi:hypothetical protein